MSETDNREERQLHLPFDQYQRYRLVTDVLERLRGDRGPLKILDVSGAEDTVLHFLDRDEVTILDRIAVEGRPSFVEGDATALPFDEGSFDYVMSVDTFEHILPGVRKKYLSELRRVGRSGVLLAAPFEGGGVREAEGLAAEFFQAHYGRGHKWLDEYQEHGLPELAEARTFYEELGDSVKVLSNGYLPNWLVMICLTFYRMSLKGEMSRMAEKINHFYNRFLYEHDNVEPCYRYLVVALKEPAPVDLGDLASPPTGSERANVTSALLGPIVSTLPLGAELRAAKIQLAMKEAQIHDLSRRLAGQVARANSLHDLQQENQRLRRQRNQIGDQLEAVTNSRTWRLATLLGRLRRLGR